MKVLSRQSTRSDQPDIGSPQGILRSRDMSPDVYWKRERRLLQRTSNLLVPAVRLCRQCPNAEAYTASKAQRLSTSTITLP